MIANEIYYHAISWFLHYSLSQGHTFQDCSWFICWHLHHVKTILNLKYVIRVKFDLCLLCLFFFIENNIAFGKPTKQLTTVNPWTSEHAVDGNYIEFTSNEFECTHTKAYLNTELSWWAVDLGGYYKVTHVVLTGRTHKCCSEYKPVH